MQVYQDEATVWEEEGNSKIGFLRMDYDPATQVIHNPHALTDMIAKQQIIITRISSISVCSRGFGFLPKPTL
jgi:hypothetical protein